MEIINLWDNVPGYEEGHHFPTLEYYKAENKRGRGAVVIFPGGGYSGRAAHEGEGYARFLNSHGIDAFVVQYRVAPTRFPYPLLDARRAVRYVRGNAEKYGIDAEKIAVMGSSAGAHLAEITASYRKAIDGEGADALDDVSPFPNAQILCYPVTDFDSHNGSYKNLLGDRCEEMMEELNPIRLVTPDTPKTFIWHTETDKVVKPECTLKYVARLHENNVRTELHLYPDGWHGMGLAEQNPIVSRWSNDLIFWLKMMKYIEE
ncbi:MAG: alpha/beta hydrolase [Clostridia bacterium]|nr:alpha/beta hydrolase [Clostridia bacterium]